MEDTIFAPMTPVGVSAAALIRISGSRTFEILGEIFSKPIGDAEGYTAHHGCIVDGDKTKDDVIVTVYRAPKSYTGEDVAEISCHGSPFVSAEIQRLLVKKGARLAQPGEFSKRAFVNGKMDIVQAEAVIDLIESESEKEAEIALLQIKGGFSAKTEELRQQLISLSADILAYIDYPDDEIIDVPAAELRKKITEYCKKLEKWEKSYGSGKIIKDGLRVCITGKPNVGKSSLMNRLSGYDKSIVTDIEGTTRDVIEETVTVGGLKLRLFDTAGIRESEDAVEKIGVERAAEKTETADLILCLFDLARPFDKDDEKTLSLLEKTKAKKIAVYNKCDKEKVFNGKLPGFDGEVTISAEKDIGISELEKIITDSVSDKTAADETVMNARQYSCIRSALTALQNAVENIELTPDVLLCDVEEAIESLSVMTGKTVSEEIIVNIFSRFCVGK